jgi:hypothetical protein
MWDTRDYQGKREDQVAGSNWLATICVGAAVVLAIVCLPYLR